MMQDVSEVKMRGRLFNDEFKLEIYFKIDFIVSEFRHKELP